MSKLSEIKTLISNRGYGTGSNYVCFMAAGQPHTVIEAAGDNDTQLIVSGNKPGGLIFRSSDVRATYNHIQTLN